MIKWLKRLIRHLYVYWNKRENADVFNNTDTGESILHIAIVNEDPAMVKFLLDNGADVHERACGNFFCPDDQKSSRMDTYDHEWVYVTEKTNYEGWVYGSLVVLPLLGQK